MSSGHDGLGVPSPWVRRFAHLVPRGGRVLDLAAGGGRHARFFASRNHPVVALDRNLDGMADLVGDPQVTLVEHDLATGEWPFPPAHFAAIVVTNFLDRALLRQLSDGLGRGGALIYETFAVGNEAFGRPSHPDYLLKPNELLAALSGTLTVIGYESGIVFTPRQAVVQRIAAVASEVPQPL